MFGETESVLYSAGYQTAKIILSRIDAATGAVQWTYGFTPTAVPTLGISYISKALSSTSSIVVGGLIYSGVNLVRYLISNGLVSASERFQDSVQTGLLFKALYVID